MNKNYYSDISDKTRETIWKYLQLLLFTVITSVNNDTYFGDTARLFEAIDETEATRRKRQKERATTAKIRKLVKLCRVSVPSTVSSRASSKCVKTNTKFNKQDKCYIKLIHDFF